MIDYLVLRPIVPHSTIKINQACYLSFLRAFQQSAVHPPTHWRYFVHVEVTWIQMQQMQNLMMS